MLGRDDEVVALGDHGDEIQAEGLGRGKDAESGIGAAAQHRHGHRHVGELFGAVAADAAGVEAPFLELEIKQDAGSRAGLAVDEIQFRAGQIRDAADPLGVSAGYDQPLVAHHQVEERDVPFRQVFLYVRHIVRAVGGVQQVAAGQMTGAALYGRKPPHAAHVARGEPNPAGCGFQLVGQHIQRVVVAAHDDDGSTELGLRPQELRRHLFLFLDPFDVRGDADDPVRFGDGGDGTRAARQRSGDKTAVDLAEFDAHELLEPQFRSDFAGGHDRRGARRRLGLAEQLADQGFDELLEDNDGGDRVAGDPEHGDPLNFADHGRFAGHDGDAVDQDLSQPGDGRP